jgi:hypothetical protein
MARFTSKTLTDEAAVFASSDGEGVHGETTSSVYAAGVSGTAANPAGIGPGVQGTSNGSGPGVVGLAKKDAGVIGFNGDPKLSETTVANDGGRAGVFGASEHGAGIVGYARDPSNPAIFAFGGFRSIALGRPLAGEFVGDVKVHGDVLLTGADCAEQFDVAGEDEIAPGAVMVIGEGGALRQSEEAYDTRVAGVVAGAGDFRPGIVLDNQDVSARRLSISLMGKAFCQVDSRYAPIAVGDLLTTSPTPGHAMKAADQRRAFGAIIGKALGPCRDGSGLIPILIALG